MDKYLVAVNIFAEKENKIFEFETLEDAQGFMTDLSVTFDKDEFSCAITVDPV